MDNDAKYVALAKAIAQKESKNNPNIYGDNGTSFGLGQWNNLGKPLKKGELPAVWKEHARIVFGNENTPMTEQNQKAVLTGMVKKWADEGLQPYEIAAKWNSGSNKGWENKVGTAMVNGKPLKYDTPSYVKEVDNLFRQFSQNIPQGVSTEQPVAQTFDIPEVVEPQASKLGRLQSEAKIAQAESKKANSVGGFLGNFGKALVENLAPSEVGLGKTIGKIAGNQTDTYSKLINDVSSQQANLVKAIRDKESKGGDATALKRIYNDNVKQLAELNKNLAEETNLPSTSKVVGQLGGTALDVLSAGTYSKAKTALMGSGKLAPSASKLTEKLATATGVPELGKIAGQKAGGLFTKQGVKNVATGAGLGYANDVTMGLQGLRGEDREGAKSLIPGLGTAIGTTLPVVSESVQTYKNLTDPNIKVQKLIDKRTKALDRLDKYQTIKKATEKGSQRGIDIKKLLAETDVLAGTVDNTGTIVTKGEDGAVAQYTKQYIDGNENIVSELLKKEGRAISPALVKARLIQKVKNAGIEGKNLTSALKSIDDEVAGYMLRTNEQGNIPTWIIHDAKIDKYNGINFFTEGATKKYDKTIAKALKEIIEETTTSADVKRINEELSKHFAVIDYLNKLDNKKVDGGKLGKYFAQTVGAIVGSNFGPLGAIAGAEAGGMVKGGLMSRTFNGKTGKIPQQAEVIQNANRVIQAEPLALPQSKSKSLGSLQTNQTPTMITTKKIGIPKSSPKSTTKSSLKGKGVTPETNLINEAKKYKSAEEFVKAQPKVFHGTDADFKNFENKFLGSANGTAPINKTGFSFSSDKGVAKTFGRNLIEAKVDIKNPLIIDAKGQDYSIFKDILNKRLRNVDRTKYDGIVIKNYTDAGIYGEPKVSDHYIPFSESQIKTKSQLTDIWKKANAGNKIDPLINEAKKYKSAEEFATSNKHIFDRSGELVKVGDNVDFSYGGSEFKGKLVKVNNFDGSYETTSSKGKQFRNYSPEVTVEATENIYNKGGFLVHKKGDIFKVNAINLNEYKESYSPIKTKSQLEEIWNKANKK